MTENLFIHVRAMRAATIGQDNRAQRSIIDHMNIIDALKARPRPGGALAREHTLDLAAHVERHCDFLERGKEKLMKNVNKAARRPPPTTRWSRRPGRRRRLRRPSGRQGAEERGRRHDLHAVRRPHHRHLRRLRRRGHPHHRRAPRAGRGARGRRLCAPDRQARLRRHHGGPGLHQCRDRHRHRASARKARCCISAGRARWSQWQMGGLQDLPHVDMMRPITKFASTRDVDRARRRHGGDGGARVLRRRLRTRRTWRSRATYWTARSTSARAVMPQPGQYRASTQVDRRSARHREPRRYAGERGAAGDPVRPAGVGRARPRGGGRAAARAGYPRLLQRRQPRLAAAGRSAPFRPHAQSRLSPRPT